MDMENAMVVTDGRSWEKNLPELGDFEVQVAPWENPAYEREIQKRISALPAGLRADGRVDPAAFYKCQGYAMARTIVFDWKNYKLGGVEKAFDKAYAETILIDPKYKPIRDGIIVAARRVQLGVKALDEDLQGNSLASSPGSASGEAIKTD